MLQYSRSPLSHNKARHCANSVPDPWELRASIPSGGVIQGHGPVSLKLFVPKWPDDINIFVCIHQGLIHVFIMGIYMGVFVEHITPILNIDTLQPFVIV